jgi:hypothetical protein
VHGLRDHRPGSLHELDVHTHGEHGRHDVREQHGRVHAVPAYRLQRHLRAELRRSRHVEERVAFAHSPILRQRAAGLAHEPDGRALDRFAPESTDEQRIRRRHSV